jgi:eukaryotic-like serine/threonine-protein kinase
MQGNVISDRYEIESRLGSGGMSTVYKAKDVVLDRTVAVKVLAEHLSDDDRFVARFNREAKNVAKLIHPNIVQVYDTGLDDGRHYIVMEYVEGRSGAQLLQAKVMLDPAVAVEIGKQACAGLEYAHRNGIIHRDVKPGNLMIIGGPAAYTEHDAAEMTVKIADFGIAQAGEQTRITQAGSVVGTAAYLAPEQARGEEATPAADVYALGVVLYQFLTGRLPYEGSSLTELAIRQQNERPLPPHTYNDHVPETLGGAVLRALESDPWRRFNTAKELSDALTAGASGTDVSLAPPTGQEATRRLEPESEADMTRRIPPQAPPPRRQRPPERRPARPPARRRSSPARAARLFATLVVLALLAISVALFVVLATGGGKDVHVEQIVRSTVQDQVSGLKGLVEDNTQ